MQGPAFNKVEERASGAEVARQGRLVVRADAGLLVRAEALYYIGYCRGHRTIE